MEKDKKQAELINYYQEKLKEKKKRVFAKTECNTNKHSPRNESKEGFEDMLFAKAKTEVKKKRKIGRKI